MTSSKRRIESWVSRPQFQKKEKETNNTLRTEHPHHLPNPLPPHHPLRIPNHHPDAPALAAPTPAPAAAGPITTTILHLSRGNRSKYRGRDKDRNRTANRPATRHDRHVDRAGPARPLDLDREPSRGRDPAPADGRHAPAQEVRVVRRGFVSVGEGAQQTE